MRVAGCRRRVSGWPPTTAADVLPDGAPRPRRAAGALGDAAVALTAELVAIDSVNPGLAPGAAGEAAVVEHLRNRLQRSGFATHVVIAPGHDDRPSLVAIGPARRAASGPTVVLTGHLDTVGVEGMPDPFTATVDGDRLSGRGSSDMKGGVAAMVVAAEALAAPAARPGRARARRRRGGREPGRRGRARRAARPRASARTSPSSASRPGWPSPRACAATPSSRSPSPVGPPTRSQPD